QKLKPGAEIAFEGEPALAARVLERKFHGRRVIKLWRPDGGDVAAAIDQTGHVPLPPYIKRDDRPEDRERYQTLFATTRGSIAAPTAGLHFSGPLIAALRRRGVETVPITLHVGFGTFQPVRVDTVEEHRVEPEHYEIGVDAAAAINAALDQ